MSAMTISIPQTISDVFMATPSKVQHRSQELSCARRAREFHPHCALLRFDRDLKAEEAAALTLGLDHTGNRGQ